jgi:biopolymer transport protein ExbD
MNGSLFSEGSSITGGTSSMEDTEVNLISLLSIMGNMLFFLLVSFGVGLISLIAANVPTIAEENTIFTVNKDKLIASLSITAEGYTVIGQNEMLSEQELGKLKKKFPKIDSGYDVKGLNEYMYELKKKFSGSDTVVITPDPEILYEHLVEAMDATREKTIIVEGRNLRYPLFPSVVVSTLVK